MTRHLLLAISMLAVSMNLLACGEDSACDQLADQCGEWQGGVCGQEGDDSNATGAQCILDEAADPCEPTFDELVGCDLASED